MTNTGDMKPRPGDRVLLMQVPPGLLDHLPLEDQQAIKEAVGQPIQLNEYDKDGRAELQFKDSKGTIHFIFVRPEFIKKIT